MTITGPDARPGAPGQAVVDAAMLVLERMGLTPADLLAAPAARPAAPTFAEYVPVVSALVSEGCRRAYGSYWNRVTEQWGSRGIDEPTPCEIHQLPSSTSGPRWCPGALPRRAQRRRAPHRRPALPVQARRGKRPDQPGRTTRPARWTSRAACPPPAGRSPTSASRRSTTRRRPPGMTPSSTPCCSASTPRPPAAGAARWRCPQDLDAEQCLIQLREKGDRPVAASLAHLHGRASSGTPGSAMRHRTGSCCATATAADHLPPL